MWWPNNVASEKLSCSLYFSGVPHVSQARKSSHCIDAKTTGTEGSNGM